MLKIVHFSKTVCAGSAIRLVQALRKFTNHEIHLIDLKRWGIYDHDIVMDETPEKAKELAECADIIHFHNYLHYDSNEFYPIDFRKLKNKGTAFIRQLRGNPDSLSLLSGLNYKDFMELDMPSIVIAQFMERFYHSARVVPNIIPQDEKLYQPNLDNNSNGIFYSHTRKNSAWSHRWETKGAPEVKKILKKVKRKTGAEIFTPHGISLKDVLKMKKNSSIVIDDLVTGSYHLSGLEGLSQGKPVFAYLDDRMQYVLNVISGSYMNPFINCRVEDLYAPLLYLTKNENVINEMGEYNRQWIDNYWRDEILIKHYTETYDLLIDDPTKIKRQSELSIDKKLYIFFAEKLPDLIYSSRQIKNTNIFQRLIYNMLYRLYKNFRNKRNI